jgi:broad specificity phosphatase PhoE
MGTLYLVRHGQASFGADDYDQLSALGARQCAALGEWLHARGRSFEGVIRGPLERHRQSLEAIASTLPGLPHAIVWPGLAEYDAEAGGRALAAAAPPASLEREAYRQHFRLLRAGLLAWIEGRTQPAGMPSWRAFAAGVAGALDLVRERFTGDVLLVASGGPIATAIAQVLQAPGAALIELNLRMHNSAVSEFAFTPKRHALAGYNALPHLDRPERADWVTYM